MVQIVDVLIGTLGGAIVLILWRWQWLRREKRLILSNRPMHDELRFDTVRTDEDDQFYSGRVIERLRARVIEGRVEIHWQFRSPYVHKGFVLSAKERRNSEAWEDLPFEPHQDSGSWIECFKHGDSRTFLFTVKKTYRFFFGLFGDDNVDVVYDQISFSLRKGRYLKEKAEHLRDRTAVLTEAKTYLALEGELRGFAGKTRQKPELPKPEHRAVAKLQERLSHHCSITDYVETKRSEIESHPSWTADRKRIELDRLEQLAEELSLEEASE
jgi:hypothetical protein